MIHFFEKLNPEVKWRMGLLDQIVLPKQISKSDSGIDTGRLPTIYVIGFPKCGTTTIHSVLTRHHDISGAVWKDPDLISYRYRPQKEHYFFSESGFFEQGIDWYANHFRVDRLHAIDSTPTYIADEVALERIAKHTPDAKFIVLLREPVSRAFSAWNHWNQLDRDVRWPMADPDGDFESNIKLEMDTIDTENPSEGFLGHGLYLPYAKRFDKFFPREQVFYGFSVEFRLDFHAFMKKIQDFLEVTPLEFPSFEANKRSYTVSPLPKETHEELRSFFRPHDKGLEEFLGRKCPWIV